MREKRNTTVKQLKKIYASVKPDKFKQTGEKLVNIKKQRRFSSEPKIIQLNGSDRCQLCGIRLKNCKHYVVQSEQGGRFHLCGSCVVNYPSAREHREPVHRNLSPGL